MEGNQDETATATSPTTAPDTAPATAAAPAPRRRRRNRARNRRNPPPAYESHDFEKEASENIRMPSLEPLEKYEDREAWQEARYQKLSLEHHEALRKIYTMDVVDKHRLREVRKWKNKCGDLRKDLREVEKWGVELKQELVGDYLDEDEAKEVLKHVKGH